MLANAILDHRRMRQAFGLLLFSGTLFCIFPVELPFARFWASNSDFVALGYLVIGLIFFLINRRLLMYISMACSVVICLYYLETSPDQPVKMLPKQEINSKTDSLRELNAPIE